jgi:hypothetical protein
MWQSIDFETANIQMGNLKTNAAKFFLSSVALMTDYGTLLVQVKGEKLAYYFKED